MTKPKYAILIRPNSEPAIIADSVEDYAAAEEALMRFRASLIDSPECHGVKVRVLSVNGRKMRLDTTLDRLAQLVVIGELVRSE